jgi:hypothetical protein
VWSLFRPLDTLAVLLAKRPCVILWASLWPSGRFISLLTVHVSVCPCPCPRCKPSPPVSNMPRRDASSSTTSGQPSASRRADAKVLLYTSAGSRPGPSDKVTDRGHGWPVRTSPGQLPTLRPTTTYTTNGIPSAGKTFGRASLSDLACRVGAGGCLAESAEPARIRSPTRFDEALEQGCAPFCQCFRFPGEVSGTLWGSQPWQENQCERGEVRPQTSTTSHWQHVCVARSSSLSTLSDLSGPKPAPGSSGCDCKHA